MERCRLRAGIIIIIALVGLACLLVGFVAGAKTTIKVGLAIAKNFITIDVDEELVYDAIFKYKYETMNFKKNEILQNLST